MSIYIVNGHILKTLGFTSGFEQYVVARPVDDIEVSIGYVVTGTKSIDNRVLWK